MERLEEMLSGIGALLREREDELQKRISVLERRIEELEGRMEELIREDVLVQEETVLQDEPLEQDDAPEVEIEIEFGEDDDWAEEYEDGDVIDEVGVEPQKVLVMDKAKPEWYDWEVDIPGSYIENIWNGIGLNDRMLFQRELFGGNEDDFLETVAELNGMDNLVQAVEYLRGKYPQWDEESDEVYRFYMTVRRRFNKQKQEV